MVLVILSLLVGQLFYKIFDFSWWMVVAVLVGYFLFLKLPKKIGWVLLPILFLLVLSVNKLFSGDSFDWEKIVWTNPGNLKLIERYGLEDLWLPFKIRNLFYTSWLLVFNWINLVFKLISPEFLTRMLGWSGFSLTLFGVIQFFKNKKRFWQPLIWWVVVVMAAGWGILIDSKSALILALPAIIYFMYLGVNNETFKKYKKWWWILVVIDLIMILKW